jgi:hypothetical protein
MSLDLPANDCDTEEKAAERVIRRHCGGPGGGRPMPEDHDDLPLAIGLGDSAPTVRDEVNLTPWQHFEGRRCLVESG